MGKKDKLFKRFLSRPKDFSYEELISLLGFLGYQEFVKGKTSGSRRAFVNVETNHIIRLHKPHPGNILKRYQINEIIKDLKKQDLI